MVDLNSLYREQNTGGNAPVDLNALYQQQNGKVNLNDVYEKQNSKVNLDVIEEIESNGNGKAVSNKGARGYMQIMPATAANPGYGMKPINLSTASEAEQKAFAGEYFDHLLNQFNGDVDKAVAAYNAGAGTVEGAESDASKHGGSWLDYMPKETRDYVAKYNKLANGDSSYEIENELNDAHHAITDTDLQKVADKQDVNMLNPALNNPYGGLSYSSVHDAAPMAAHLTGQALNAVGVKNDLAQRYNAESEGGQLVQDYGAPLAASFLAPELVPEIAGFTGAGAVSALADAAAGSIAYQALSVGDITAKQTAIDMGIGGAMEGGMKVLTSPALRQAAEAFNKFRLFNEANPELEAATKDYLGAARAEELGLNWQNLRETNPDATLLDAYEYMGKQVPDVFESGAIEDVKPYVRKFKNNGSHSELISSARTAKQLAYEEAKALAKTDAERRLIDNMAQALDLKSSTMIPDSILPSTPFQKIGEKANEYFGVSAPKAFKASSAAEALKPETEALIKDLKGDNRRIGRELNKLKDKKGVSIDRKVSALNRQRAANNKMIAYLNNGLQGKKVNISDIQLAIKEAQEEQFSRGKFKGLTTRFKNLSDKFDVMQVHKLQKDSNAAGMIADHYIKKGAAHVLTKAIGISSVGLTIGATAAGKIAQMAKVSNLMFARGLSEMVEHGEITENEAEDLIRERFNQKGKNIAKAAPVLGSAFRND